MTTPAPLTRVHLKVARRSNHPWIFQKMVERPATRVPPGSLVDVYDRDGNFAGRGFFNGHSRISLRILTHREDEVIDEAWIRRRLQIARDLRESTLDLGALGNSYRLCHSEADGMSGLIIDKFDQMIVVEYFSAGWFRLRDTLLAILGEMYPGCQFYWFAEEHVQKQEAFDCHPIPLPAPIAINEHGLRFRVAPGSRHKTGFFLDQRENRRRLATYCKGKTVLDICCNSGGFAVYAKSLGEAEDVTGIDLDEEALEMARTNAGLNGVRVKWTQTDLFPWLRDAIAKGQTWDVVILDPAKQTRDRDEIGLALKKYLDMNRLAMQVVKPGGILLSCSCTGLVNESDYLETLRRSSWQAGKHAQVFAITGAAADHPFFCHVSEGRYLKAVWMRIMEGDPIPPRPAAPELEVERFEDNELNDDISEAPGPDRPRFGGPGRGQAGGGSGGGYGGNRPGGSGGGYGGNRPGGQRPGGPGGFRPGGPRPFGSGKPFKPRPFGGPG
jgi:23S rRNA (cytosine1962-C5)-methyltransferase